MKLIVTSDIHEDLNISKRLIESIKKENPDLVVLLGDLGEFGNVPRKLIGSLLKYIENEKILVVLGNHETPEMAEFLSKKYNIRAVYKYLLKLDNINFICIGGADMPLFMVSDSDINSFLNSIKEDIKDKKVVVLSHIHPRYTKSSLIGGGSIALYNFIKYYKPLAVIHGHIHETGGLEEILHKTKVVNTARSIFLVNIKEDKVDVKKLS